MLPILGASWIFWIWFFNKLRATILIQWLETHSLRNTGREGVLLGQGTVGTDIGLEERSGEARPRLSPKFWVSGNLQLFLGISFLNLSQ